MIKNAHTLVHAKDGGNGYHGNCQHCGVALVTDLGYCSWDGLKCVDREIEMYQDIPKEIRSLASFRGLVWDNKQKIFNKPYTKDSFTIDALDKAVKLQNKLHVNLKDKTINEEAPTH